MTSFVNVQNFPPLFLIFKILQCLASFTSNSLWLAWILVVKKFDVPEICVVGNPTTWKLDLPPNHGNFIIFFSFNYPAAGVKHGAEHWEILFTSPKDPGILQKLSFVLVFNLGTKSAANVWGKGRIMQGMDFYAANGSEGHSPVMTFCPSH